MGGRGLLFWSCRRHRARKPARFKFFTFFFVRVAVACKHANFISSTRVSTAARRDSPSHHRTTDLKHIDALFSCRPCVRQSIAGAEVICLVSACVIAWLIMSVPESIESWPVWKLFRISRSLLGWSSGLDGGLPGLQERQREDCQVWMHHKPVESEPLRLHLCKITSALKDGTYCSKSMTSSGSQPQFSPWDDKINKYICSCKTEIKLKLVSNESCR